MKSFNGIHLNPIGTVENNLSKNYLFDLQKKNVSVVPTLNIPNDVRSLKELNDFAISGFGNKTDFVIKPLVFGEKGMGVTKLSDLSRGFSLEKLFTKGSYLVQPMVENVLSRGENSYIFVGGIFSHALNKFTGEFKINFSEKSKYSIFFKMVFILSKRC